MWYLRFHSNCAWAFMPISSCYVCIIYMGTPGIQFTARVAFIMSGGRWGSRCGEWLLWLCFFSKRGEKTLRVVIYAQSHKHFFTFSCLLSSCECHHAWQNLFLMETQKIGVCYDHDFPEMQPASAQAARIGMTAVVWHVSSTSHAECVKWKWEQAA